MRYRSAKKLCQAIRRLDQQHDDKSQGKLSISIGITMYPNHGNSSGALIQKADECLYLARKQGRDRVVSADSTVSTQTISLQDHVAA
jgi:diguanylate cyclase (GGDEF)-like protein